jgi:hypothetical protein
MEDRAEVEVAGHASLLVGLTMKMSDGVRLRRRQCSDSVVRH